MSLMHTAQIRAQLRHATEACSDRGLWLSSQWLAQLLVCLPADENQFESQANLSIDPVNYARTNSDTFQLAKSLFDCREFERCAATGSETDTGALVFITRYAAFLSIEKREAESRGSLLGVSDKPGKKLEYQNLLAQLTGLESHDSDAFLLFLQAILQHRLRNRVVAISLLAKAVTAFPWLWAAWLFLAECVEGMQELSTISEHLPDCLPRQFFTIHATNLLHDDTTSKQIPPIISRLLKIFPGSLWLKTQMAQVYYDLRELDSAQQLFEQVYEADPYRVDSLETYSNILYIMSKHAELSDLAQRYSKINPNRSEVCCVVGNYFSLRGDHEKALIYFRRALKLDNRCLAAWTLAGHEYLELKNTHAAIEAYRRAVDVDAKDYRAWYGLGQTYEMLEMHSYAVHYYQRATALRPNDPRMWTALATTYDKDNRLLDALACAKRSMSVSAPNDLNSLLLLAEHYKRAEKEDDEAIDVHRRIVQSAQEQSSPRDLGKSYILLGLFEVKNGNLTVAQSYFDGVIEKQWDLHSEAQRLLRKHCTQRPVDG